MRFLSGNNKNYLGVLYLSDCPCDLLLTEPRRSGYLSFAVPADPEDPETDDPDDPEDLPAEEVRPVFIVRLLVVVFLPVPVPLRVYVLRPGAAEPAGSDPEGYLRVVLLLLSSAGRCVFPSS